MKTIALVILLGITSSILAKGSCVGAVLDGYSKDSNSFQLFSEEVSDKFEEESINASLLSIKLLEEELSCAEGELAVTKVSCNELAPGRASSRVCYAESDRGYFLISVDMMENVTLTFSRWD